MQKDIFLESEGDAWFQRNRQAIAAGAGARNDSILECLSKIKNSSLSPVKVELLEVGCSDGWRLEWIQNNWGVACSGIDPSSKAVQSGADKGVRCVQGTADSLPFKDASFDVLVYGFCLYLCDRADLFKIAAEGHRVLKPDGWIVIKDFFSPTPLEREYHHHAGIVSHKMDYRRLFDWHPAYSVYHHEVRHHAGEGITDEQQEWVSVSILRKKSSR